MDARYSRQVALPGFGTAAQGRLSAARVLVIGAGGLGSAVLPTLAGAGVGTIGIVDDDTVDATNLHRQHIHGTDDIGRSKTESAAESIAALNPGTLVITRTDRLTSANALPILSEYDLVIDGSDNFATRYLAADAASLTGIPLVWGSVSQFGGQASVSWPDGPGYRDLFPSPPPPGSVLSCEAGGVFPTAVTVIGGLMATEALKILSGVGSPLRGRVTLFDALTGEFSSLDYLPDPSATPVTRLIDYEAFCGIDTVTADEVSALADDSVLLDVREPWEAEIASIRGSVLIPLGELSTRFEELDRSRPVVVYCHHGVRSASARQFLVEQGYRATHLAGGIDLWARRIDPEMERY
ncbi:molybdopterin/thiamine biosynthesis adenylyltransferase/rhodanese-related sulfurtransferase [Microbacteriaceae bacterium SG_E_30_P1]|uniref:Molybdopterin/thiamine biosynthesis adenylyltransferase/rhodanese-related sulfurtransferase n=1 Tax=Antiquaquibacter oligotrophicus TaxID=2880260 RepID=A0ABT6KNF4_9MICO|nr:ThiF family adenylyltransferase [Antiquaquibacter oligotrophicus]MDH6181535.1 molybdopterin/thiamine biosynthesis adenylyltransferase/rhodanese-related sulfurtransferase [Antiquaquibacter oligotrophicus]UDF12776.1 ThiF family adenylyltransferase [Antiquaquibacter oligotrophicus]